ncbi:MAG: hypothetical protein QG670_279 [Thermoproteota archaeon]|nr:hypothetical protein [Thermoproteota archaeon]
MIYEWRVYEVVPGKMNAINERFQKITTKFFDKYGIRVVGFWQADIGTSNVLYYMLAWDSLAQREKVWSAFSSDPDRLKAFRETEKDGPLVERVVNTILRPTAYSPMK